MTAYVSLVCLLVGALAVSSWCSEPEPGRWPRARAILRELWPAVLGFWASMVLLELFAHQARAPIAGSARVSQLSTSILVALPIVVAPARLRAVVGAVVIALLAFLTYADLLYSRQFGSAIPTEMFGRVGDAWQVRSALAPMMQPIHLVFLLVAGTGVVVWAIYRRLRFEAFSPRSHALSIGACVILALPGLFATRRFALSREAWTIIVPEAALGTGLWSAHLVDVWRKVRARSGRIERAEIDAMRSELDTRKSSAVHGVPRPLNVLFVQVESLNAWALDVRLGEQPVMPALGALRDRGVFVRLLDQAGIGRSSDADLLALTSQHPLPEAPVSIVHTENHVVALPALLAQRGYGTASFSCDSRSIWQGARRHALYGVEHTTFGPDFGIDQSIDCDARLVARVREWLAHAPRPWFGWAITLGMHVPYEPLPPGRPRIVDGELSGSVLGNYLDVAHDTDRALGELWRALDETGLAKETIVVVYGDHTTKEPLADREALAALVPATVRADPLWKERVPLVVVAPELRARVEPSNAGLLDVAPTVLDLLSLDSPRVFLGRSLFHPSNGFAARWDGTVSGANAVFVAGACQSTTGEPLSADACADLRTRAEAELSLSFRMTRHDLFRELSER